MTEIVRDEIEQLEHYARRRVAEMEPDRLSDRARAALRAVPRWRMVRDLLAPERMSIGYHTGHWGRLTSEERLALNHLFYVTYYYSVAREEQAVVAVNEVIAQFLEPRAPAIAGLLRRENEEERDHMEAFRLVREEILDHYGIRGVQLPDSPLRKVLVRPKVIEAALRIFGADFVVVFFLGRGLVNHMGRGFERAVAGTDSEANGPLHRLSFEHSRRENHHTAVSRMLSASARSLMPEVEKRSAAYRLAFAALRRVLVWSTFSERITRRREAEMAFVALRAMPLFAHWTDFELRELLEDHYTGPTSLDSVRSAYMPQPNARLMRKAALPGKMRAQWCRWIDADSGWVSWFPNGLEEELLAA